MSYLDTVRVGKSTKTEQILGYLQRYPNEELKPKEIAESLGFNLKTTVTILNRLANKGMISKRGRGKFSCHPDDKGDLYKDRARAGVDTLEEKYSALKIDKKTAGMIYKTIYHMASDSAGAGIIGNITALSLDDFDENAPVESIQKLVSALSDLLGKRIVDDIVGVALERELAGGRNSELKHLLNARRNRHAR